MGGGSKTQTTNSTQTRDPYAPTIPALGNIISGATSAYNSGVGSQVYGGQRVAGLGDTTQAGLDSITANANAGTGAAQAGNNFLQNLLQNGGSTAAGASALQGLLGVQGVDTSGVASAAARMADPNGAASTVGNGLIGGNYALDGSGYAGLNADLAGPTQTAKSLQDVADGKFLGGSNPYLDKIISQGAGDAASTVAQQFAASGRYGSGRFAGATADAVDRVGTQARYADYDAERTRQAQAASAIDSAGLARTSARAGLYGAENDVKSANANQAVTGAGLVSGANTAALTGANALAALAGSNADRSISQYGTALNTANGDRAASLAGLGAVGTNANNLIQPGQTLAGVGAIQDAARQAQLTSDQSVFDEQQQAPWKQLGLYSGVVDPIAGLGGTATGTETKTVPQPSLMSQILGGAATGVGLLGATGAFPTAARGTASAGWLSSLFGR